MQLYTATLVQLVRNGAKRALNLRGPRGPTTCAWGGESRCKVKSEKRAAETKGVNQLWLRIPKSIVLPLLGRA
jgi:hypothetical protein